MTTFTFDQRACPGWAGVWVAKEISLRDNLITLEADISENSIADADEAGIHLT